MAALRPDRSLDMVRQVVAGAALALNVCDDLPCGNAELAKVRQRTHVLHGVGILQKKNSLVN